MFFIDFLKKKKSFKTVVCRSTHVHRGYGRSHLPAPSSRSEQRVTPSPGGVGGDGRSIRHRVMKTTSARWASLGTSSLPAPLPVASAYISSMYSTVVLLLGGTPAAPSPPGVQHAPRAWGWQPLCERNRRGRES